uniref:golgin subfamily A member 8C-like isoform X1 n=2 Tax=Macaca mulatta TaxID=9544 RepID=UPI0010A298D1|nr:golgin subfamily A member 8C-like isoform X1 [Macaca mulatta]XP_028698748.1 golgin subfamily A member 8C-like isoform X1 [Macaca mulatta]
MLEKADLKTTVYHTKRAATPFEGESKDLTSHLQYSLQRIGELEQAPSAVSMQQQEEDRNSENKSALQLEQQVKELQEKKLSEVKEMEMKEDIWTLRRRRCLSPCQASWRTWRAGRPCPEIGKEHLQVPCLKTWPELVPGYRHLEGGEKGTLAFPLSWEAHTPTLPPLLPPRSTAKVDTHRKRGRVE